MKLVKTAEGTQVKLSKKEWQSIGKTAGWVTAEGLTGFSTTHYMVRLLDSLEEVFTSPKEDRQRAINLVSELQKAFNGLSRTGSEDIRPEIIEGLEQLASSVSSEIPVASEEVLPIIQDLRGKLNNYRSQR